MLMLQVPCASRVAAVDDVSCSQYQFVWLVMIRVQRQHRCRGITEMLKSYKLKSFFDCLYYLTTLCLRAYTSSAFQHSAISIDI